MIINTASANMHARKHPNVTYSPTALRSPSSFLSPRSSLSRQSLLSHSPPPSPALPSLLPRHGKKPVDRHSRFVRRLILWGALAFLVVWWSFTWFTGRRGASPYVWAVRDGDGWQMRYESSVPEAPSAVVATNLEAKTRWTVSIPEKYGFPLLPRQYSGICAQIMPVMRNAGGVTGPKRHKAYDYRDPNFVDVREAREQGFLEPVEEESISVVGGEKIPADAEVCEKSLTYVMETLNPGFGKTLLDLWTAFGLAKEEGRAFFIDDSYWAYGNYTSYFALPPMPGCRPPPRSQLVPCPHVAQHLVVSAATRKETFGHMFNEKFEDPKKMEVQRLHRIFGFARDGLDALFRLREDDAKYVAERIRTLYKPTSDAGGISVAMHVRRGDRHPFESQYSKDYLPLDRYTSRAGDVISTVFKSGEKRTAKKKVAHKADPAALKDLEALLDVTNSQLVVASDDPDVYTDPEMRDAVRAQSRIALASRSTLAKPQQPNDKTKLNKFVDEVSGWEGGFFNDVFWSLGRSSSAKSTQELREAATSRDARNVNEQAMGMRELVGRAYLLDLTVLGQADAVVCALSSTTCRLLGVMIGWAGIERAGGEYEGRWRNVDGSFDWRGIEF